MRSSRLLVGLPAALRPGRGRAAALALALVLLSPAIAVGAPTAPSGAGAAPISAAALPPPPGTTTLVSARVAGGFANGGSTEPSVSANGRYVAFTSVATDLVALAGTKIQPPSPAVFVRDRRSSTTIIVPLPPGVSGGGSAGQPAISADGNVVAFTWVPPTPASTVVVVPVGPLVLAWDRRTGTTEVVSLEASGAYAYGSSTPSVSRNGRYVAYTSLNAGIVRQDAGTNADVFRYDRNTHQVVLVSAGPNGLSVDGSSTAPSISADGNLVAFVSDAGSLLVNAKPGSGTQVYLRDLTAGRTEWISVTQGGGPADGPASGPSISANGRYVAFASAASNLAPGDDGRFSDVFRRDRQTGSTVMVSVTPTGQPGGGTSGEAAISRDGRMVAFASVAPDLVEAATGYVGGQLAALDTTTSEVFERDVDTGETILVSVAMTGGPGGSRNLLPAVAGNGRYVAFASQAATLVAGNSGSTADIFMRDFPPFPTLTPAVLDLGSRAIGTAALPAAAVLANAGWTPVKVGQSTITGPAHGDFTIVADGCNGRTLHHTNACTISVAFVPTSNGSKTATLEVSDDAAGSPRTAQLRASGSQASLTIDPDIGPPGIVVIASGSGFPAGASIRLRWSAGITPTLPPVVADASGRFRIQVLVFHSDVTGPRDLIAEPVDGTSFPPVSVAMLVTMPSMVPPGFLLRQFIDLPLSLVIRG